MNEDDLMRLMLSLFPKAELEMIEGQYVIHTGLHNVNGLVVEYND